MPRPNTLNRDSTYRERFTRTNNRSTRREFHRPLGATDDSGLPQLIQANAPLQSSSQLLLMYSHFQSEMPADGKTPITTWLRSHIVSHGLPSLIRFGPRSRPRVFRKDEFVQWLPTPVAE